jgi:23S rRNA pseudouridine1911/1915/1917 synthase
VSPTRKLTASGRDRGVALADFLAERLEIARGKAATLIRAGGVYVGRVRVESPDRALDAGERVTVHDPDVASRPEDPSGVFLVSIAHDDKDVIVADKPAGVPTQATRSTARGALDRIVQQRDPGARLLHRIDRAASGLVLFTRHSEAHARFGALLRDRRLLRRYVAVARGHIAADHGRLDAAIGPDPHDRRRMAAFAAAGVPEGAGKGGPRPALTYYRVLRRGADPAGEPTTLVELDLATGRTHQIRVHLASAGHPLVGDQLYGAPDDAGRLCLHATRLGWPGREVTSPVPDLVAAQVGGAAPP